jgi:hypothetical protein
MIFSFSASKALRAAATVAAAASKEDLDGCQDCPEAALLFYASWASLTLSTIVKWVW